MLSAFFPLSGVEDNKPSNSLRLLNRLRIISLEPASISFEEYSCSIEIYALRWLIKPVECYASLAQLTSYSDNKSKACCVFFCPTNVAGSKLATLSSSKSSKAALDNRRTSDLT